MRPLLSLTKFAISLALMAMVCSLAAVIVLSHRAFPKTELNRVNPWPMIQIIWEPPRH